MLWEVSTGTLKHTINKHAAPVTACAWLPDSQRFVTGGHAEPGRPPASADAANAPRAMSMVKRFARDAST